MNNRKLKFRVWDKIQKKMFYPKDELKPSGDDFECFLGQEFTENITFNFVNDDIVIQQFTGLLDKNDKEIYEGDIVKCSASQMMINNTPIVYKSNYYGIVEYSAPSFILRDIAKMCIIFWAGVEIISNIFENLELLEKK